jgi:3-mercaptopyruvate sulfurtransferase SseA
MRSGGRDRADPRRTPSAGIADVRVYDGFLGEWIASGRPTAQSMEEPRSNLRGAS